MAFEFTILDFIQQHLRSDWMDKMMVAITHLGDAGIIWIILTLVLLLIPKMRKVGIVLAVALVFDLILCNCIVKPFIARIRPYDINTAVELLIGRQVDYSFPSGHTAAGITCTVALYAMRRKWLWKIALFLSILIAFSRMYLYVHFPTDIIGGVVIGVVCGILGYVMTKKFSYLRNKEV
ncbi:MAG: phosphatase PAP2 family protein [Lachnospiraceae bacterium]